MPKKIIAIIVLALILRIYGINWDQGFHLHPDERMLIMVADNIRFPSQLNPHFFNYGSLPIYILKGVSQLIGSTGYDNMLLTGRRLSVLFDLLTVIFIYKITTLLFRNKNISLAAAFLYCLTFFSIQNSHFFTVDIILTCLTTVLIYALLKPRSPFIVGIIFAAMLATKITAIIFLPVVVLVLFFRKRSILDTLYFILSSVLFFFFFMPYAFIDNREFLSQTLQQIKMNGDPYVFPYTLQYVGTLPYWYYLKNIFLWGLGPIISILSFTGLMAVLLNCYIVIRKKHETIRQHSNLAILLAFNLFYFIIIGHSAVKFMRYMLPIYPFLTIMAGYGLYQMRKQRILTFTFLLLPFLWTLMFMKIYTQPNTRVTATDWILKNIPAEKTILVEYWDDQLPLSGGQNYNIIPIDLYGQPDNQYKWSVLNDKIRRADYIIIASNRVYVPLQKLADCSRFKECFPKTNQYYKQLFNGKLGFKKVAEFTDEPIINDQSADESFTVYDHPKVMIFKKTS